MDVASSYKISYSQTDSLHWILGTNYALLIAPKEQTIGDFFANNASLYTNGWNFQYVLETPTEEAIELPTLKTFDRTTILSTNTTIKPLFEGNY